MMLYIFDDGTSSVGTSNKANTTRAKQIFKQCNKHPDIMFRIKNRTDNRTMAEQYKDMLENKLLSIDNEISYGFCPLCVPLNGKETK